MLYKIYKKGIINYFEVNIFYLRRFLLRENIYFIYFLDVKSIDIYTRIKLVIECSLPPPWLPPYVSGWVLVVSVSVSRTDAVLAAAGREAGAALRRGPQGDAPHLHRAHQRG